MTSIHANDVRIPSRARAALARHERVLVLSHGRPAFIIANPDDVEGAGGEYAPALRGRPLREAVAILAAAPRPDHLFARDLERAHADGGTVPPDPWEPS